MSIEILKANAQVTIQDAGRWKYQSSGVPVSGPIDDDAFRKANLLVGNRLHDACIEMGTGYLELKVSSNTLLAFTGFGHTAFLDHIKIPTYQSIFINQEALLKLKPSSLGLWSYLAFNGGANIPTVLNSKSTYLPSGFGGLNGRVLKKGDTILPNENQSEVSQRMIRSLSGSYYRAKWFLLAQHNVKDVIRIMPGPEWNWLTKHQQEKLLTQPFFISTDSNRMGYRLTGAPILREANTEMISSGVMKGTIQLANNGNLIVLMADSQTVGGYPRIAQVAAVDVPILAQRKPGAEVRFSLISHEESEQLFLDRAADYRKIETGIRLKYL